MPSANQVLPSRTYIPDWSILRLFLVCLTFGCSARSVQSSVPCRAISSSAQRTVLRICGMDSWMVKRDFSVVITWAIIWVPKAMMDLPKPDRSFGITACKRQTDDQDPIPSALGIRNIACFLTGIDICLRSQIRATCQKFCPGCSIPIYYYYLYRLTWLS